MKNRDKLPLGTKPAPGDLAFAQTFVNIIRHLENRNDIDRVKALKDWLAHHGLVAASAAIGKADYKKALSFHNALRTLIRRNSGEDIEKRAITALNRLVDEFKLTFVFMPDATVQLRPSGSGIDKALGLLLAEVIMSTFDGRWQRLKVCSNPACQWVFYDSSKNHSGRWCAMSACGARSKARAYRKRRAKRK